MNSKHIGARPKGRYAGVAPEKSLVPPESLEAEALVSRVADINYSCRQFSPVWSFFDFIRINLRNFAKCVL